MRLKIPSHIYHQRGDFHVIAVISNPRRYHSRYHLYEEFVKHMNESFDRQYRDAQPLACTRLENPVLWTIEVAYGDRSFAVTNADNPHHIQLRTGHELWHKENMINVAIAHISKAFPTWKYVAWVDADIEFANKDWIDETLHQLQHYKVVQMWENAVDLGPTGQTIAVHHSFMSQYVNGKPYNYSGPAGRYYEQWHPGFAWAARREAIDAMGGLTGPLISTAILGAGDNHMAHALVNMIDRTIAKDLHPNYWKHLISWQERAERKIRRNVGIVPGTILHNWHGKKKDRRYHDRWKILVDNQYDPDYDLEVDAQGLWQLADHGNPRSIKLRDDIRNYFCARNEDSLDTE